MKSVTRIYNDAVNGLITQKLEESNVSDDTIVNSQIEIWKSSDITAAMIEKLTARREKCLKESMNLASEEECQFKIRALLCEAQALTKTLTLINTGDYK